MFYLTNAFQSMDRKDIIDIDTYIDKYTFFFATVRITSFLFS